MTNSLSKQSLLPEAAKRLFFENQERSPSAGEANDRSNDPHIGQYRPQNGLFGQAAEAPKRNGIKLSRNFQTQQGFPQGVARESHPLVLFGPAFANARLDAPATKRVDHQRRQLVARCGRRQPTQRVHEADAFDRNLLPPCGFQHRHPH
jgi:hypothetical protein